MTAQTTRLTAYGLIHDTGKLLLCRLSSQVPNWHGHWTLPGGGVDFGEDPQATVCREVEEETGLLIAVENVVLVNSVRDVSRSSGAAFHGVRILYRAHVIGGALRPETHGTTDLCAWHPLHSGTEQPLVDLAVAGLAKARELWPLPTT